jgi:K(+)-stimulated pyrophosphate-energized sodium pump
MQEISNAIKEGAEAFLRRQNRTIGLLAILLAVVIFLLIGLVLYSDLSKTSILGKYLP